MSNNLEEFDDFMEEDTWNDQEGMKLAMENLLVPPEWTAIHVTDFKHVEEIDTWLKENMSAPYKRFGWYSACNHNVGVAFESIMDAILFKMRWC